MCVDGCQTMRRMKYVDKIVMTQVATVTIWSVTGCVNLCSGVYYGAARESRSAVLPPLLGRLLTNFTGQPRLTTDVHRESELTHKASTLMQCHHTTCCTHHFIHNAC